MNGFELIVGEGLLDACAARRVLHSLGVQIDPARCLDKGGKVGFWRDAKKYENMSRNDGLVFALTDLDLAPCASGLIQGKLGHTPFHRFILRIAAQQLESWLLADAPRIARYLQVPNNTVPRNPDGIQNPKQALVNVARGSRSRDIRSDMVPEAGMSAVVGKNYTRQMERFIERHWQPLDAAAESPSLTRAIAAVKRVTGP